MMATVFYSFGVLPIGKPRSNVEAKNMNVKGKQDFKSTKKNSVGGTNV